MVATPPSVTRVTDASSVAGQSADCFSSVEVSCGPRDEKIAASGSAIVVFIHDRLSVMVSSVFFLSVRVHSITIALQSRPNR
jgi:hypothetical protein